MARRLTTGESGSVSSTSIRTPSWPGNGSRSRAASASPWPPSPPPANYARPGIAYRPVTGVSPSQVAVAWPPANDADPVVQDFVRCCLDNKPGGP